MALRGGRVAAVLWALCVIVLVAVSVLATVSTANANARAQRLSDHGVPVQMTVTRCLAISSGVGMGIEYWQCRGTYTVGSRTYEEVIGGQRSLLDAGQKIDAVADPDDPSLVSVPGALGRRHSYTLAEVMAGITAAVIVAGAAVAVVARRRRPAPPARS